MKKLMFAVGVFSFLLIGAITIENLNANIVYDDPPKKEVKSDKDCSKTCASSAKCCSSKSTELGKKDKEGTKTKSTASTDTKKNDPDKK